MTQGWHFGARARPSVDPSRANGAETARRHIEPKVLIVSAVVPVGECRARLERERFAIAEIVLVVDEDGRYLGVVPIGDLLPAGADGLMGELADRRWPAVPPGLDQEKAVEAAAKAGITTLPVVDAAQRPLGCIPAGALIAIAAAEHREDVHRMAGILRETDHNRHALEDSPMKRLRGRLPWLIVGLLLSTAGTIVMAGHEETLKRNVTVAFFIPALVYLTDAIGTQTEAVAVRGLSVSERPFSLLLAREVATGGLIGIVLGIFAFLGISLVLGDVRLATAVALSLVGAGALASAIGLTLPWLLSRFGADPALGSGPVATIIQDVLTLLVYLTIATSLGM